MASQVVLCRRRKSRNGGLRAVVDGEYIGTRVMSRHVEIELAARDLTGVDLGVKYGPAVELRTCKHIAQPINNRAAAAQFALADLNTLHQSLQ